ncbi:Scr1 family TA system antitoxin-like transcriptional regulator [Streptomyces sp. NPDC058000]|uniref:Scr1 family TA system antitoxin-like transcriptional regulator n=1 Tax=Streptomyces sp. NPDC058000 TaxID=3346299 RepID=UPI0036E43F1E
MITESVLKWRLISPTMMAAQLDKLITMSRMPNISIGVVPLSAPMTDLPSSSFALFDNRLVIVEIPHAKVTTTEPRDIERYVTKFDGFEQVAVADEGMRTLMEGIRDDFLREQEIN